MAGLELGEGGILLSLVLGTVEPLHVERDDAVPLLAEAQSVAVRVLLDDAAELAGTGSASARGRA